VSTRRARSAAALLVLALVAGTAGAVSSAEAASKKQPKLEILVSNDDGVGAEGIAVLVDTLRKLRNVKVTVAAPATNQTGAGGKTTDGEVTANPATTATGYEATAVNGFPADSVNYALDHVVSKTPNVVVSGVNEGQNLGGFTDVSGTVGAARAAVARGIPALAVSAALDDPDYPTASKLAADWIRQHRVELSKKPKSPVLLESLNVPTCPNGTLRGVATTTVATATDHAFDPVNCASTIAKPADDITAYINGFASLAKPSPTPASPPA
jgi:5'-nucleotidase